MVTIDPMHKLEMNVSRERSNTTCGGRLAHRIVSCRSSGAAAEMSPEPIRDRITVPSGRVVVSNVNASIANSLLSCADGICGVLTMCEGRGSTAQHDPHPAPGTFE